jgi:hypothetical protein
MCKTDQSDGFIREELTFSGRLKCVQEQLIIPLLGFAK